jgi:hypothetical protein
MTINDHSIPPFRDLPRGRLHQRKEHLLAEIAFEQQSRRSLSDRPWARRSRWTARPALVGAGAALAAVLAGGAFALTQYVFVGEPAPTDVQAQVEFNSGVKETLQSHAALTGVIVSQTKAAAVLDTVGGPAYLWVAPTTSNGYCLYLDFANLRQPDGKPNLEGGCTSGHPFAIDASFPSTRLPDGKGLALVYGYVQEPATRIEVHFQSGATKTADMSGRYFLVEVPAGESPGTADRVISVDAVSSDGKLIATQQHHVIAAPTTPDGPTHGAPPAIPQGQIAPPAHP